MMNDRSGGSLAKEEEASKEVFVSWRGKCSELANAMRSFLVIHAKQSELHQFEVNTLEYLVSHLDPPQPTGQERLAGIQPKEIKVGCAWMLLATRSLREEWNRLFDEWVKRQDQTQVGQMECLKQQAQATEILQAALKDWVKAFVQDRCSDNCGS